MLTLKEVNEKINQSTNKEWLNQVEADFDYPHLNLKITKKGFPDIFQYVARQKRTWDKIDFELPIELKRGKQLFDALIVELKEFIEGNTSNDNDLVALKSFWTRRINAKINSIVQNKIFPIDSPTTSFLIDLFKQEAELYKGAYEYLIDKRNVNLNNSRKFAGALMAYEFEFQEPSSLPKRRRHEKSSISSLRNSFEAFFSETQKNVTEFYSENKKLTNNYSKKMDALFSEKESLFNVWFDKAKKNEKEYNKYNLGRVKELESLYSDKLMLEKPADYWDKRATNLKGEAKKWLTGLIVSSAIAVLILLAVLAFISNGTLAELFSKTGSAIRWSIVFITLISFLAYMIRTFTKLAFSAYHLVRDAEERKQLVYVYLSLKQDKAIKDEERILILQSIFSRADSGLLKEDSSPAMPGSANVMDKLFQR